MLQGRGSLKLKWDACPLRKFVSPRKGYNQGQGNNKLICKAFKNGILSGSRYWHFTAHKLILA